MPYTPNNFPPPEGPKVVFSNLVGGGTTTNFTLAEAGYYQVGYMALDTLLQNGDPNYGLNNPGQLLLQQVAAGVTTTLLTFAYPGVLALMVPQGGIVCNFNYAAPGVKSCWAALARTNFRSF